MRDELEGFLQALMRRISREPHMVEGHVMQFLVMEPDRAADMLVEAIVQVGEQS